MSEVSTRDITNDFSSMHYGLLAQNHLFRIFEYETNQSSAQRIWIHFIQSFSAPVPSALAHCESQSCFMRIVFAVHILPVTAITFFQTHGVECSPTCCNQSEFFSCIPNAVPE